MFVLSALLYKGILHLFNVFDRFYNSHRPQPFGFFADTSTIWFGRRCGLRVWLGVRGQNVCLIVRQGTWLTSYPHPNFKITDKPTNCPEIKNVITVWFPTKYFRWNGNAISTPQQNLGWGPSFVSTVAKFDTVTWCDFQHSDSPNHLVFMTTLALMLHGAGIFTKIYPIFITQFCR
jgi:hypothetical protein